jgi:hypothetical protein
MIDTCLDELAFRECEKDGCTDAAHESSSVAGLTRRKSMACDQHSKSIRQRWANKFATLGCLCRSLVAMNQETCCTLNKRRVTRRSLTPRRGSTESLQTKASCKRSISSLINSDSNLQDGSAVEADKKACCNDKTNIAWL